MPRKQITLDGVEGTLELPYGDELPYGGDDSQQVTLEEANPQFISQEDMTLDGISGRLLSGAESYGFQGAVDTGGESYGDIDFSFDTEEVNDPALRADVARMDTDEEIDAMLDKRVTPAGHTKNTFGQRMITQEGLQHLSPLNKQKLIERGGNTLLDNPASFTRSDIADWRKELPPLAAGVGATMFTGGLGAIPAMAWVGGATAAGKAVDEFVDYIKGDNLQPLGDVTWDSVKEGLIASTFELGGRALRPLANMFLAPNTNIMERATTMFGKVPPMKTNISPEKMALIGEAEKIGARPSIAQATTETARNRPVSRIVGTAQNTAENVLGNPRAKPNLRAVLKEKERLAAPQSKLTQAEAGDSMARILEKESKEMAETASRQTEFIEQAVDTEVKNLQRSVGKGELAGAELGEKAVANIVSQKKAFSKKAQNLYQKVDNIIGKQAIVPVKKIKLAATKILNQFPETKTGGRAFLPEEVKRELLEIQNITGEKISFAQAQNIRSTLNEIAYTPELLKGVPTRHALQLKAAVNRALDDVAELPEGKAALEALDVANKFYAENIKKFDDAAISVLTRDLRAGGSIQPDKIVATITNSKSGTQINKIKQLVKPEVWENVRKERLGMLFEDATNADGVITGRLLHSKINTMGSGFDAVFGKDSMQIRNLVKKLRASEGKLDPVQIEKLEAGDLKTTLQNAVKAKKDLDAFQSKNFIKSLSQGEREFGDAIDYLYTSKNPRQVLEAKKHFGESSEEWLAVKDSFVDKMLKNLIGKSDDGLEELLKPGKLVEELESKGPIMKAALGESHFKELMKFGRLAAFLHSQKTSSGLVAANVALSPLRAMKGHHKIRKLVGATLFLTRMRLMAQFLSSENALRMFTTGVGSAARRKKWDNATRSSIQAIQHDMRSFADAGIDTGSALIGNFQDNIDTDQEIQ